MTSPFTRAPWRCDVEGSFAWRTCCERWPTIVESTARALTPALLARVPHAPERLRALAAEIATGVVQPLRTATEGGRWDLVDVHVPWHTLPWYVGESYLYARIAEAVEWERHQLDPFQAAKDAEEGDLMAAAPSSLDDALWRSLWGNRADLSLPSARDHAAADEGQGQDLLVVDERQDAVDVLAAATSVAIITDNAGVELWADLQLARFLVDAGAEVTLLAKDRPFFVSDATPADVERLEVRREALGQPRSGASVEAVHHFTGPALLHTSLLPMALHQRLADVDVIVAKGDCNYRRLAGDSPWTPEDTRAFGDVVKLPAPTIVLRTLKAEVLVGAEARRCAEAAARDPQWLVNGRCGVVQVSR